MKNFENMTRKELAEYIVDKKIREGHYSANLRNIAIKQHLTGFGSDKETLLWMAKEEKPNFGKWMK